MRKTIPAAKLKKLPISTDVWIVNDKTGETGQMWIISYGGKRKVLKGIYTQMEIKEREGWHYEVEE